MNWVTRPISQTCETRCGAGLCGQPTAYAYPAHPGGWMALCEGHGAQHEPYAKRAQDLIASGETWAVEVARRAGKEQA